MVSDGRKIGDGGSPFDGPLASGFEELACEFPETLELPPADIGLDSELDSENFAEVFENSDAIIDFFERVSDPDLSVKRSLEQELARLETLRRKTEEEFKQWTSATKDSVTITNYGKKIYERLTGKKDLVEIVDNGVWKKRFRELDSKIAAVKEYLAQLESDLESDNKARNCSPERPNGKSTKTAPYSDPKLTPELSGNLSLPKAENAEELLSFKLDAAKRFRHERDYESAIILAAGALMNYRDMQEDGIGSVNQTADGSRSLTSIINEQIRNGVIKAKREMATAAELEKLADSTNVYSLERVMWNDPINGTGREGYRRLSKEEVLEEAARLLSLEQKLGGLTEWAELVGKEFDGIEAEIGSEHTKNVTYAFAGGVGDFLNDPTSWIMVASGAGAGFVGREVMVRLAARGLPKLAVAAVGLAVEGVAFHNLQNAGTKAITSDAEVDWGVAANIDSTITIGWLKAVGKGYGKAAEKIYFRYAKEFPVLFKLFHGAGMFASEVAAFASKDVAKKVLVHGEEFSRDMILDELVKATQMVIGFRAMRLVEQGHLHDPKHGRPVAIDALAIVDRRVIKANESGNTRALQKALGIQTRLQMEILDEQKKQCDTALAMRSITEDKHREIISGLETQKKAFVAIMGELHKIEAVPGIMKDGKKASVAEQKLMVAELFTDPEKLRRSRIFAELGKIGTRPGEMAEPIPEDVLDGLAKLLVEVYVKTEPILAEHGKTWTLRGLIKLIDLVAALSIRRRLMPVTTAINMVLPMQFKEPEIREKIAGVIGSVTAEVSASTRDNLIRADVMRMMGSDTITEEGEIYKAFGERLGVTEIELARRSAAEMTREEFEEYAKSTLDLGDACLAVAHAKPAWAYDYLKGEYDNLMKRRDVKEGGDPYAHKHQLNSIIDAMGILGDPRAVGLLRKEIQYGADHGYHEADGIYLPRFRALLRMGETDLFDILPRVDIEQSENIFDRLREPDVSRAVEARLDHVLKCAEEGKTWAYTALEIYCQYTQKYAAEISSDALAKLEKIRECARTWGARLSSEKTYVSRNLIRLFGTLNMKEMLQQLEIFKGGSYSDLRFGPELLRTWAIFGDDAEMGRIRNLKNRMDNHSSNENPRIYHPHRELIEMGQLDVIPSFREFLKNMVGEHLIGINEAELERGIRIIERHDPAHAAEFFKELLVLQRQKHISAKDNDYQNGIWRREVTVLLEALDRVSPGWDANVGGVAATIHRAIKDASKPKPAAGAPRVASAITPDTTELARQVRAEVRRLMGSDDAKGVADIYAEFARRAGVPVEIFLRQMAKEMTQEEFIKRWEELKGPVVGEGFSGFCDLLSEAKPAWAFDFLRSLLPVFSGKENRLNMDLVHLAIARLGDPRAVPLLRSYLSRFFKRGFGHQVQRSLALALIAAGDPKAFRLLERFEKVTPLPLTSNYSPPLKESVVRLARRDLAYVIKKAKEGYSWAYQALTYFKEEMPSEAEEALKPFAADLKVIESVILKNIDDHVEIDYVVAFKLPGAKEVAGVNLTGGFDRRRALAILGDGATLSDVRQLRCISDAAILIELGDPAGLAYVQKNPSEREFATETQFLVMAIVRIGGDEAIKTLKVLLEKGKLDCGSSYLIARYLDQLSPGWDTQAVQVAKELHRIIPEEIDRSSYDDTGVPVNLDLKRLVSKLPKWDGLDVDGKEIPAEKRAELDALIPKDINVTAVDPTTEALSSTIAGILAAIPVYQEGETGTGKNLMFSYLACVARVPFMRLNFGRDTDNSQLYGHYEVTVDPKTGQRRVAITDGRMIDALKYGAWVLWDEVNLANKAFLVNQNDIVQQIRSGKVFIKRGGKVREINVHKNFRLFAAGNPESYADRQSLEDTFTDRWHRVWVREFSVKDLREILKADFPALDEDTIYNLPGFMAELKTVLGSGASKLTLRTLKRIARRIEQVVIPAGVSGDPVQLWTKDPAGKPVLTEAGMRAFAAAFRACVLDDLDAEQYGRTVEALGKILPRGNLELQPFLEMDADEGLLRRGIEEYKKILDANAAAAPAANGTRHDAWEELIPVETTVRYALKVLDALKRGDFLILKGVPALAKSAIPKWIGKLTGQEVMEITGSKDTCVSDLVGSLAFDENGDLVFEKGYFVDALERGAILMVNEANQIPVGVWERLNSVFDDSRDIFITENGVKRRIKVHPNFRLVLTLNPREQFKGGRVSFSQAMANKFVGISFREQFTPEEMVEIVTKRTPSLSNVAPQMVEAFVEAGKILSPAGLGLTVRDLNRMQDIAVTLGASGIMSPADALIYSAELVFAGRVADEDLRDRVLAVTRRLGESVRGKIEAEDKAKAQMRERVTEWIGRGGNDLRKFYEELAAEQGVDFETFIGSAARRAGSPEELTALFDMLGLTDVKERIRIIKDNKLRHGVPLLLSYAAEFNFIDTIGSVTSRNLDIVKDVLIALGEVGVSTPEVIGVLNKSLTEGPDMRSAAVALAQLGVGTPEVVNNLISQVETNSGGFGTQTKLLGNLGAKMAEDNPMLAGIVDALKAAAGRKGRTDRVNALDALTGICGGIGKIENGRKILTEGLGSEDGDFFRDAAGYVFRHGVEGDILGEVVPLLRAKLESSSLATRIAAAKALLKLGVMTPAEVGEVVELIRKSRVTAERLGAVYELAELGPEIPQLIEALRYLIDSKNNNLPETRRIAASALDRLDPTWRDDMTQAERKAREAMVEVLESRPAEDAERTAIDAQKFLDALRATLRPEALKADTEAKKARLRKRAGELLRDGGKTGIRPVYEEAARDAGVDFNVFIDTAISRVSSPEELEQLFDLLDMPVLERIDFIKRTGSVHGVPMLLELSTSGNDDVFVIISALSAFSAVGSRLEGKELMRVIDVLKTRVEDNKKYPNPLLSALQSLAELASKLEGKDLKGVTDILALYAAPGNFYDEFRGKVMRALCKVGARLKGKDLTEVVGFVERLVSSRDSSINFISEALPALAELASQLEGSELIGVVEFIEPYALSGTSPRDNNIRRAALSALGTLGGRLKGSELKEAGVVGLIKSCISEEGEDIFIRANALLALGNLTSLEGEDLKDVIGFLVAYEAPAGETRQNVLHALGNLASKLKGKELTDVIEFIKPYASPSVENSSVRHSAISALGKLALKLEVEDVGGIIELMGQHISTDEKDYEVRLAALSSLSDLADWLENKDMDGISEILGSYATPDWEDSRVRCAALSVVVKCAPRFEGEELVKFIDLLKSHASSAEADPNVRRDALSALADLAPRLDSNTIDDVVRLLEFATDPKNEDDLLTRDTATQLLDKLKPSWRDRIAEAASLEHGVIGEILDSSTAAAEAATREDAGGFLGGLAGALKFGSAEIAADKLAELQALIPGEERVTMVAPMADAVRAAVTGIIANTPVLIQGETSTGKNLLFRLIAHAAGVPLYRFSFNRSTDSSQLYGHFEVVVDPVTKKRRVAITDGRMIDALTYGGIALWDEVNLASPAFLVSQNDIVQQIASGKVWIKRGGKPVQVKVNKAFRLAAAGNFEGDAGRKALEETFADRWLRVVMREMNVEDQRQLLKEENEKLAEEDVEYLPQILNELKQSIGSRGSRVTVRTLKRVAGRIEQFVIPAGVSGDPVQIWNTDTDGKPVLTESGLRAYVEAIEAEVLDGLDAELYRETVQALEKALPRGSADIRQYLDKPVTKAEFDAAVADYRRQMDEDGVKREDNCNAWEKLVPVPTTIKYAMKVLDSLKRKAFLILEGDPAVSKSAIPKWLGMLTGQEVIEVTGDREHTAADLMGMPTLDSEGDLVFESGYFVDAMEKGAILLVNEGNQIAADVWERLNPVFDGEGKIFVSESGKKREVVVKAGFRLVITQNQKGRGAGRKEFSPAMQNRFRKIVFRDKFAKEEKQRIVEERTPQLKNVAPQMVEAFEEAQTVLASASLGLTMRDLNRWQDIAVTLGASGIMSPADALVYSAELVFAGRVADLDLRDRVMNVTRRLDESVRGKLEAEDKAKTQMRERVTEWIDRGGTEPRKLYEELAAEQGVDFETFVGSAAKRAGSPEELTALFDMLGLTVEEQIKIIGDNKLVRGVPFLLPIAGASDDTGLTKVGVGALAALGKVGVSTPDVIEVLNRTLTGHVDSVAAAEPLAMLGVATPEVIREILDSVSHGSPIYDDDVFFRLLGELGSRMVEDDTDATSIIEALKHKVGKEVETETTRLRSFRIKALDSLADFGVGIDEVDGGEKNLIDGLDAGMTDGIADAWFFCAAAGYIFRHGVEGVRSKNVTSLLQARLESSNLSVRISAAKALLKLGVMTLVQIGELVELVRGEKDEWVRLRAAEELVELGPDTPHLVEVLRYLAHAGNKSKADINTRAIAAAALDRLDPTWRDGMIEVERKAREAIVEVLSTPKAEESARVSEDAGGFLSGLAAALKFGDAEIAADKLAELRSLIPGEERVTMVAPMADAVRAAVTGIIANTPVLVQGETSTGKNLLFRLIAHAAGVPLYRFSFNRSTDSSQLYGHFEVVVDPKTKKRRVAITDGRMIDALTYGGIALWDEVNLASPAFLVSQNDIVQQIASGKVWIKRGGKPVQVKVSKAFRLAAAGNFEGDAGRKALEETFADRWLRVVMREMNVEDQRQLLKEENEKLAEEDVEYLPQILNELKQEIGSRGSRVTVRTLKRVAGRIEEARPPLPSMGEGGGEGDRFWTTDVVGKPVLTEAGLCAYVEAIEAEVLDGLDAELYKDAVQTLEKALPRGSADIRRYLDKPVTKAEFDAAVADYRRQMDEDGVKREDNCNAWEKLVPVPTTIKYAMKVLDSLKRKAFLILEGDPAVSKSAIPKWIGWLTGQKVIEVTGDREHTAADLMGMPTLDDKGNLTFESGYFVDAMEEGAILLVNEGNQTAADVWERLNPIFDGEGKIFVSESGKKREVIVKAGFRLVITQNQKGRGAGRKEFSPAMQNRFRKIVFRDKFAQAELEQIARVRLGLEYQELTPPAPKPPAPAAPTSSPPSPASPPPAAAPVSPMAPAAPAIMQSAGQYSGETTVGGVPAGMPDKMAASALGVMGVKMDSVFGPRRRRPDEEGIPERMSPEEAAENERKMKEAEALLKKEFDDVMEKHGGTIRNLSALAGRKYISVRMDTRVDLMAMDMDSGTLYLNPLAVKEFTADQIAAMALHEGGHAAITRITLGNKHWFKKRSLHFLLNCLEDPRVNEYELARLPGAGQDFRELYDRIFPGAQRINDARARGEIPPEGGLAHEEFATGFIHMWAHGNVSEAIADPEVRAEIERLAPIARQIWQTLPDLFAPRNREVIAKQNEVNRLIEEHILPVYKKFYEKAVKEMGRKLKDGAPGGEGGRSGGSIDPEDLDAEARKILEERAGRMADKLEPKPLPPNRGQQVNDLRNIGDNEDAAGRKPGKAGEGKYGEGAFRPYNERTYRDIMDANRRRADDAKKFYSENTWRKYFDPVQKVATEVAEALRQILKLDADFEWEGDYTSGQALNVRKAIETIIRNEVGIYTEEDFKLFLRKRFPTKRRHKFVLVLDESGSMKGEAQSPAMQAMMLFQHVMDQLGVDYAVVGFADYAQIHKGFDEKATTIAERNGLADQLETSGGGGTNDLEGVKVANDLLKEEDADEKTVIVITDGAGVDTTKDYVAGMEKEGTRVIGIGIGPGTEFVKDVYASHYQENDFASLAKIMVKILARRMLGLDN